MRGRQAVRLLVCLVPCHGLNNVQGGERCGGQGKSREGRTGGGEGQQATRVGLGSAQEASLREGGNQAAVMVQSGSSP